MNQSVGGSLLNNNNNNKSFHLNVTCKLPTKRKVNWNSGIMDRKKRCMIMIFRIRISIRLVLVFGRELH